MTITRTCLQMRSKSSVRDGTANGLATDGQLDQASPNRAFPFEKPVLALFPSRNDNDIHGYRRPNIHFDGAPVSSSG